MAILRTSFVIAVPDLDRSAAFYRDVLGFGIRAMGDPVLRTVDGHRILFGQELGSPGGS
jgi:catechol 2,3-dioxygenase-like lactoylglutathione lyase family enzyme